MIVVDRAKIKFLLAGRALDVANPGNRHVKGRSYALGTSHKRSVCRVQIVELDPEAEMMRVRLANTDSPRLLAARSQYGYTDKPHRALRGEPEAVSEETSERLTKDAQARRREELAALKSGVIEEVDRLADGADRLERRRLRNVRRAISSL